ncbi:hypothetical protein [Haloprofundus halophilus]|uniref:hypothetical protein n=1 Tax=Haloprofundus halophilus TaxID=2283527 RepID=UPI0013004FB2|nr:hypothetical protein [Haloprofundus halophilus]
MDRRQFFLGTTTALAFSISAGCSTTTSSSPTATESSASEGADGVTPTASPTPDPLPNVPNPTSNCEISELPDATYPSLPSSVSESSVESYSLEFEKAYSSATVEKEWEVTFSGFDGWDTEVMQRTKAGFVVRVWVSVDFTKESGSTPVAGSEEFYGWYYVTDDFAVRAPGDSSDSIPSTGWETVACK